MPGLLLILSGPSGVGKDSILDALLERNKNVQRVIAKTTRAPRAGETHGVDYYFCSVEDFLKEVERGQFLEHKEVHGNLYGTPVDQVEILLDQGKIAVLKIDVQGAEEVLNLRPDAVSIFLMPPSMEELKNRITGRGTDSEEVIEKRLVNAQDEIAKKHLYQYHVVNEDIMEAVREIENIVERHTHA